MKLIEMAMSHKESWVVQAGGQFGSVRRYTLTEKQCAPGDGEGDSRHPSSFLHVADNFCSSLEIKVVDVIVSTGGSTHNISKNPQSSYLSERLILSCTT